MLCSESCTMKKKRDKKTIGAIMAESRQAVRRSL